MPKRKAIKTLADLRDALYLLTGGQGQCEGVKSVSEKVGRNSRSTSTHYFAHLFWSPEGQDAIYLHELGDSPADAYRNCCLALQRELEERARKRQLERRETKAIERQVKCLEYHPTGS